MSRQDSQNSNARPEVKRHELPIGEWLYKIHGEVLGPVDARAIVEHMYAGEVDESTKIKVEDGEWQTIQSLPEWHPFLYQAKAQIRANQARAEAALALKKRRLRKMINIGICAIALILVSFAVSYVIIVQRPGHSEEALAAWAIKHVPLLSVPVAKAATLPDDSGEEQNGDLSGYGNISIDDILIEDAPDLVALKPDSARKKKRKRRVKKKKKVEPKPTTKPDSKDPAGTKTASIGMLSQDEIRKHVYARSNMNRLKSCLVAAIKRNPDLPGRVVVSFSIKNDGRVHNVKMDDIRLENGPLRDCFARKLARLRLRAYQGQVQNVTIPFDWKR